ncbi:hypothetical protein N1031_03355 [Herbiconiux moechotypicola]|uniref:Uncharacterized protein n=1 Tax=Herbiconiux moechotypicola TaxID=637393 RepID=A0ABN3DC94_9MICO|nr:hypothetical protein [Herbiconiux moechotypicola]MCS5728786.1 hypothetical protein [Herbiconiux moechotypicola]
MAVDYSGEFPLPAKACGELALEMAEDWPNEIPVLVLSDEIAVNTVPTGFVVTGQTVADNPNRADRRWEWSCAYSSGDESATMETFVEEPMVPGTSLVPSPTGWRS